MGQGLIKGFFIPVLIGHRRPNFRHISSISDFWYRFSFSSATRESCTMPILTASPCMTCSITSCRFNGMPDSIMTKLRYSRMPLSISVRHSLRSRFSYQARMRMVLCMFPKYSDRTIHGFQFFPKFRILEEAVLDDFAHPRHLYVASKC